MATVQSSLRLFDAFTGPLKNITQALNMTISSMQQMQRTTNQNANVARTLDVAKQRLAAAESQIKLAIDQSTASQDRFNRTVRKAKSEVGGLLSEIKGVAAAYLGLQGIQMLATATIGGAMQEQQMRDMLVARTGDQTVGSAMFDKFKADALKTGMDVKEALTGTLSFFSMTQDTRQLEKLNNLAQRLAAFDTTGQGLSGATFSIKEAMSGDLISLAERFNMSKAQIRAVNLTELGKKGDIEGFIKAFDQLLEIQKMGQNAFDTMLASPIKQAEILRNNVKSMFADAGGAAVQRLLPLILMLNQAFQQGTFQPFFNALSIGLAWAVSGMILLIQAGQMAWSLFTMLSPVILSVASALAVYYGVQKAVVLWTKIHQIYTNALTTAQRILNAVMTANPYTRVIMLVVGLIVALATLGQTSQWLKEAFASAFGFLVDLAQGSVNVIISFINGLIRSINTVAGFFGNLLGVGVQPIQEIQYRADLSGLKAGGQDFIRNFSLSPGAIGGANPLNTDILDQWNKNATIAKVGEVGEVGKIGDTVDISNEDLKVMRELAEMKSIQNFVTLTPTVQVTTGDINNGYDVDTIVKKIADTLEEQIASSAEGVYS
ncbi:hypothetical protein [Heliophilum fasciatum]|uniref:Tape measure domain-containing protein n=1 Tax=Heliophilum fasciatum TaxID=35700 RepID=A0A4R2S0B3_9FIRM|nr:hypothetical protein [Heliophilum fasciatum]MCW2277730.1 hypothetical protein [Heliophilum fasciatum]TCP64775.1 hypothetical protein EDD73_108128 [Heliophilum fasciatum]